VNLTPKQRDLLQYVCAYLCEHGRQPTYRECMERFGIRSTNGVACHFVALKRKGYIGAECHPHGLRLLRWPDGSPFRGLRAAEYAAPLPLGEPATSETLPIEGLTR
jgi:SOS-response transcriptional repressor LexA